MDEVAATGGPIMTTKHGQPVCQLAPYDPKPKTLYGALKGSIILTGGRSDDLDIELPWLR